MLESAGKGGFETEACKVFADDIVEIIAFMRATIANVANLTDRGCEPDRVAVGQVLFEMCLCRAVDLCLTYLSNVLQLIYRHQPGTLKSKEKIKIEWAMQFSSMDELIQALAEKKVHSLSYRSLSDLDEYLSEKHGISLFVEEEHRSRAVRLVDFRNLIVHNHGIVNRFFSERNPQSTFKLGDRVRLTISEAQDEFLFLIEWIMNLDFRICQKYPIPTQCRIARPRIPDISSPGTALS